MVRTFFAAVAVALLAAWAVLAGSAQAQAPPTDERGWADRRVGPDERADLLLARLTTEEKLALLSSNSSRWGGGAGLAGLVPGIARFGIGPIKESDAGLGVALRPDGGKAKPQDEATPLPSGLAVAATWNPDLAYSAGAMIAEEARRKGISVLLAGAANLTRDPRNGRNFEYAGEDPLLTGTIVGEAIRGIGDRHVISTMKHFALNDQETNRTLVDAHIDRDAFRASDLLAFEITNERGHPGAIMCSYNLIHGVHACEDDWLLDRVLRREWGFRGWVMSDWGAVHSTVRAARAGLDQESGPEWDAQHFFGAPLMIALDEGALPRQQIDVMARRILRTLFAGGVIDDPPAPTPLDVVRDAQIAGRVAQEGSVLLKNAGVMLPLPRHLARLAVIGGHADIGVLSGGGSSQVMPIGGAALREETGGFVRIFDPSSPLKAIAAKAPQARVEYADDGDPAAAVALARRADAAIVFATRWEAEGRDAASLSLGDSQDRLIAAVAAVNPRTIVVLETGNPVLMPWRGEVAAILEAWYPGARGGEAIADLLFGDVNPSGRLPMTFPAGAEQLPRPDLPGRDNPANAFPVEYREGAAVGYKWFDALRLTPLYPFGFGLSYTRFVYSDLRVDGGERVTASFAVTNAGGRRGADVPQLYVTIPDASGGAATPRLVGWRKVDLAPGESTRVTLTLDPRLLAHFDGAAQAWRVAAGDYRFALGANARDLALTATAQVKAAMLPP